MPQYFEYDASLAPDRRSFSYYFGSERFAFQSDSGLFSAGHMDEGTNALLHCVAPFTGSLLDLGCGWGGVGVVLGRLYTPAAITMADINPKALELAQLNCEANGVHACLTLSDGFAALEGSFDVIALNPPIHAGKETVYALYEGAKTHLKEQGAFYVVILKKHGAQSTISKLTELFGGCETLLQKKGLFVLRCVR